MSNLGYTWRKEWINEYESFWSIKEKFKYANSLYDKDINRIFRLSTNQELNSIIEMSTLKNLDVIKFSEILGINLKEQYNKVKPNSDNSSVRKTLFFCPECMKLAYHSLWFQNKLIEFCPIHEILLSNTCPNCKSKIPYILDTYKNLKPYQCKCGFYLWEKDFRLNFWDHFKIRFNALVWDKCYDGFRSENVYTYYNFTYIINHNIGYYLNLVGCRTKEEQNIYNHKIIITHSNLLSSKDTIKLTRKNHWIIEERILYIYIRKTYKLIYSSIARYIRRKILKEHKNCIIDFKNNVIRSNSCTTIKCPYTYAYFLWRKEIDGYDSFNSVENGRKIKRWDGLNSIHPAPLDQWLLYTIYSDLKNRELIYKASVRKWVFSKIISHVLLNRYYNFVEIVKTNINKNINELEISLKKEIMPLFILKYPLNNEGCIEFHWWDNNI